jgi:hypothetical protein
MDHHCSCFFKYNLDVCDFSDLEIVASQSLTKEPSLSVIKTSPSIFAILRASSLCLLTCRSFACPINPARLKLSALNTSSPLVLTMIFVWLSCYEPLVIIKAIRHRDPDGRFIKYSQLTTIALHVKRGELTFSSPIYNITGEVFHLTFLPFIALSRLKGYLDTHMSDKTAVSAKRVERKKFSLPSKIAATTTDTVTKTGKASKSNSGCAILGTLPLVYLERKGEVSRKLAPGREVRLPLKGPVLWRWA